MERAEGIIRALGAGRVTLDWPAVIRRARASGIPTDDRLSPGDCAREARSCLRGVDDATHVWFLLPPRGIETSGLWTEMGYALKAADPKGDGARLKTLIASGPRRGIFWALAHEHFTTDAEALARIRREIDLEKAECLCTHGVTFDEDAAREVLRDGSTFEIDGLGVPASSALIASNPKHAEVRRRWPRGQFTRERPCPSCGFVGIAYASIAHYIMGDW